jgi:hypothetical protein
LIKHQEFFDREGKNAELILYAYDKEKKGHRGCKSDRGIRATRKVSIMLLYDRDIIVIARLLYYEDNINLVDKHPNSSK